MSSSVGDRIKELRTALKLTQVQFAENIGVKGGVVSAWEKGSAPLPQGRLLIISDTYGVNSNWIMKGEGEMFASESDAPKSKRDAALDYVCSILRDLPEERRRDATEFLRELVRRFDSDYEKGTPEAEPEFDEYEVVPADDDFNNDDDDDFEEFDLEEDYDD